MALVSLLFGDGGLRKSEMAAAVRRNRFSDYLPYVAYDPDSKTYLNSDDTLGMLWECVPLTFAGERAVLSMEGLLRVPFPKGAILQFILHADPHIDPILDAYKCTIRREGELFMAVAEALTEHFRRGAEGTWASGQVLRNYRLFVAAKWPREAGRGVNLSEIHGMCNEALTGAGLAPRDVGPEELLDWLRRLLNDSPTGNLRAYNDTIPIRKQAIFAETIIRRESDHVQVGRRQWRCLTPKTCPQEISPLTTNRLFGGVEGMASDADQVPSPFLYSLTVLLQDQKTLLHAKCNAIMIQQAAGSFVMSLARKKEEYVWATGETDRGKKFYRIIPILWVYDEPDRCRRSLDRARRLWENQNFLMQEDRGILPILLVSSLPFGLYDIGRNVEQIDRHYITPADTIAVMVPNQGDFGGVGRPEMLFVGRKGQVATLDLFDPSATNHNAYLAATSGGGKSFLINYLATNYYAAGAKIRIIDIGFSYKKMTHLAGARFLDFSDQTRICINPFTNIIEPEHDIPVIAPIVAQMVYSATDEEPTETEMSLLKNAVWWAWENEGNKAGIDHVHHYLAHFGEIARTNGEIAQAAEKLAFNITDFTSKGPYGRFFNGPSTFDIASDDFVVLELEHLEQKKELFKVVTLQIVNAVTKDLYLSNRQDPRFIIFDEAWKFLNRSDHLREVIEEGYRRARKFKGSFNIVTQSILDIKRFGPVGDVIWANSAFKFFLESGDFARAETEKLITYDPFTMNMLTGIRSRRKVYSEIFMDTPSGCGVARLVVDPFSYYAYTSDADEIAEIESMVQGGMSYVEAIRAMVDKYRRNG
ncbi:conjugal transfer ATP-binding protein TraC [Geothermobacter ehrlichii]|uniref:Conjugal transfer ATP-binding protein TraC n=1 Tax=Geothermobacter ehrlichii TaxID=213224 RepID=A0A5D3WHT1_9BACT|nr:TraC family protein [Geothermobacter ehrlichii]TYO96789.1 conjugal transfer ATP-binding protein TraC [Geothermobacter ehrlichii]